MLRKSELMACSVHGPLVVNHTVTSSSELCFKLPPTDPTQNSKKGPSSLCSVEGVRGATAQEKGEGRCMGGWKQGGGKHDSQGKRKRENRRKLYNIVQN